MSKAIREHYSEDFRLRMLSEYYDSGMSLYAFAKEHDINRVTFLRWTKTHESEKSSLPLQPGSTDEEMANRSKENYKDENAQLKKRIKELEKALEFSRLETLARDVMIDKAEEYFDIPIRKKSGAKQP
jgi:transposase-like protein